MAAIGAVHVAWGLGSSFPFRDRETLADTVVGAPTVPGARESFAVAALLGVAAGLVADVLPIPPGMRRLGVLGVAAVLAMRAGFGITGKTELLVAGSNSPTFVAADRRVYGPLCAVLSLGALASAVRP
jgi:hypothetical protein